MLNKRKKKVCVIGLGYIGLPTAALLANEGYDVFGVDINQQTVDIINSGKIHIVEPNLDLFVDKAVKSNKLVAVTNPVVSDIFIIAVPTPFHEGKVPNIDYVLAATTSILPFVKQGDMIILESTSPIGTTKKIAEILTSSGISLSQIYIAHCPERVLPGNIMKELVFNDRIIGGVNVESTKVVSDFYKEFVKGEVISTDSETAELCKLAENSFRDVNIAFANELSMICEKSNINVWELIRLANRHPRVNILNPGPGVGGHCIAVDPWFIASTFPNESKLIRQARLTNDYKIEWVIEKIIFECNKFRDQNNRQPSIGIFGLAFKPNIDDLRESPAVKISSILLERNMLMDQLNFVEPNIEKHELFTLSNIDSTLTKSDIIVFLVSHNEFKNLSTNDKIVLDFCGITH
jgi:UDP-N-acetyl-D-mannosaminuronic acid dehydrogenase